MEQAAILEKQVSEQEILCGDFGEQVLWRIHSLRGLESIPLTEKEIEKLKIPFQYTASFLRKVKNYPFFGKPFRPFIDDLRKMNDFYTKNHSGWKRPKITEELSTLASKAHSILQEIQAKD